MRVLLTGVACVGKSTVGERLAALLGWPFRDLDLEVERHFGKSIERIRADTLTGYGFRQKASEVLRLLFDDTALCDCVIALPPSGLMDRYWSVIKKRTCTVVVLTAPASEIVARAVWYDVDSKPIAKQLTEEERAWYIKDARKDMTYFGRTYTRAALTVNIAGCGVEESARKVLAALKTMPAIE